MATAENFLSTTHHLAFRDGLIELKVLRRTRHKIGHFGDVLPSHLLA